MKTNLKSALLSFFSVAMGIIVGGALGVLAGGVAGIGLLWLMIVTGPKWNGDAATGLGGLIILTAFVGGVIGAIMGAARALRSRNEAAHIKPPHSRAHGVLLTRAATDRSNTIR